MNISLIHKPYSSYTIVASWVIPTVCSVVLFTGFPDWRWENEPVHVGIEVLGSFSALALAAIFLLLEKPAAETAHQLWVSCAMIAMGILDFCHIWTRQPDPFIWLRGLATATGGLFFALVWLPARVAGPGLLKALPRTVMAASLACGIFTIAFPRLAPSMLSAGTFTAVAKALNLLGGVLFLSAAAGLVGIFRRGKRPADLLLANLCVLFGVAGLLFTFSSLWSAIWWFWHLVRLVAYLLILRFLFANYRRTTAELLEARENLELKVRDRTLELAVVNRSLQAELDERRRVGERIRALYSRQEAILVAVPDIIMEVDSNKVYTWANPAGFEFFGGDVLGKEAACYFEGEQNTYAIVDPLFKGRDDIFYLESWQRRADGEKRLLAWWCRALKDENGNVTGALLSARDITESKRAEELFQSQFVNSPDIILIIDGDFKILAINQVKAGNFTTEGLKGADSIAILPPEHQDRIRRNIMRCLETGVVQEVEHGIGDGKWVRARIVPIWDANRNVKQIMIISTDITERKKTEDALRESEERFRSFFELTADMVVIADIEGFFRHINPAWSRVLGYLEEELLGRPFLDFVHPDDKEKTQQVIAEKLKCGETVLSFENRYIRKDGGVAWLEWTSQPNVAQGYTFAIARDITLRKQAEDKIKENESRLRYAQQIAGLGFWDWNILTGELYWSDETYIHFGVEPQEFVPTFEKFASMVHPDDLAFVQEHVDASLQRDAEYNIEFRFVRPNGEIRYLYTRGDVTRDAGGKALRFVGSQIDITERKKAEEELERHRHHLEELVEERTAALEDKTAKLERLNKLFIGRELRIKELKERIRESDGKRNAEEGMKGNDNKE